MERRDFLGLVGMGTASLIVPNRTTGRVLGVPINQNSISIYQNYVRGIYFRKSDIDTKTIVPGEKVKLIRERRNEHDSYAVAVYYKGVHIGYIPAYENIVIANLLDNSASLSSYISIVNDYSNQVDYRRLIAIEIFLDLQKSLQSVNNSLQFSIPADEMQDRYRGLCLIGVPERRQEE